MGARSDSIAIQHERARLELFKTRALTLFVITSNVAGNVLLSRGMHKIGDIVGVSPWPYLHAIATPWVAVGICILAMWMLADLALLSRADLSYVLPVTASAYVLIAIVGEFVLQERISGSRWAGIVLISVGVMMVGETKPDTVHATGIEDDEDTP